MQNRYKDTSLDKVIFYGSIGDIKQSIRISC